MKAPNWGSEKCDATLTYQAEPSGGCRRRVYSRLYGRADSGRTRVAMGYELPAPLLGATLKHAYNDRRGPLASWQEATADNLSKVLRRVQPSTWVNRATMPNGDYEQYVSKDTRSCGPVLGNNAVCPPSRRRRPHKARSRGTPPGDAVALRAAILT